MTPPIPIGLPGDLNLAVVHSLLLFILNFSVANFLFNSLSTNLKKTKQAQGFCVALGCLSVILFDSPALACKADLKSISVVCLTLFLSHRPCADMALQLHESVRESGLWAGPLRSLLC